jgi:hypothetical protein
MIYQISKIQDLRLKIKDSRQAGITLLLAILILASVLAISFSLATIMFIEVRDSGDLLKTEPALYAATGVGEQAFFNLERHICTGNDCSYTTNFANNVQMPTMPTVLSTSTPIFIDKVKTGSTFSNTLNKYDFCNATAGASGCGYGKAIVSYIPTNNNNDTLHAYLCQFDPNAPYLTTPCTVRSTTETVQDYWAAPNSFLDFDGGVSMGLYTNSSVSWNLIPGYQQQLILTNPTGQADIYVKIQTFGPDGTTGKGLPYVGETVVAINTQNASVGRRIQVIVPNSSSGYGVAPPDPPTISKAFTPTSINLNSTASLTFTITNPNASASLSGVGFSDPLPSGLVVQTPSGLSNGCGGTAVAAAGSGSISLSGASLAANSNCTLSVTVKGTSAGLQSNLSNNVTSTEGGTGNTASDNLTVNIPSSPPTNLVLTQPLGTNNKSFSVSWTGGSGNGGAGGCKLQFFASGSTWTDITSATNLNCDATLSTTAYNLNADGWKVNWGGTQVRVLRVSDSVALGTFGTTLACSWKPGSTDKDSSKNIDEDCDGNWNNTTSNTLSGDAACQAQGGGNNCMTEWDYSKDHLDCAAGWGAPESTYCTNFTGCQPYPGWGAQQYIPSSDCSYTQTLYY